MPIYVCSKNQFFRENVVIIAFSELRPGSNERYENSTFYGPFRFLIFKKTDFCYICILACLDFLNRTT